MAQGKFSGSFNFGDSRATVNVTLFTWEENGIHFIYSPSLDITGYGNTLGEAEDSFKHTMTEFVTYANRKGTIFDELERLGWAVNRRKKRFHAPEFSDIVEDNEDFNNILKRGGYQTISRDVNLMPA